MKQSVNVCVKVWHEAMNKLCIQMDDEVWKCPEMKLNRMKEGVPYTQVVAEFMKQKSKPWYDKLRWYIIFNRSAASGLVDWHCSCTVAERLNQSGCHWWEEGERKVMISWRSTHVMNFLHELNLMDKLQITKEKEGGSEGHNFEWEELWPSLEPTLIVRLWELHTHIELLRKCTNKTPPRHCNIPFRRTSREVCRRERFRCDHRTTTVAVATVPMATVAQVTGRWLPWSSVVWKAAAQADSIGEHWADEIPTNQHARLSTGHQARTERLLRK